MKRNSVVLLCLLVTFMIILPAASADKENEGESVKPKVLILLGEWFGDAYFPLKDRLEALGWEYYRVGVDEAYRGCYNKERDVELKSDLLIPDFKDFAKYVVLIIPSGPQFRKFIANDTVLDFVKKAYDSGLVVASFCTGDVVVNKAGLYNENPDWQMGIFPGKITVYKDRLIIGPRGGGPPPGDGYKSVPYDDILETIATELIRVKKDTGK